LTVVVNGDRIRIWKRPSRWRSYVRCSPIR